MSNNNLVISQEDIDKLIDLYYKQPRVLYEHLFASYNQLVEEIVPYSLVQEANHFYQNVIENNIYLHGFKCSNIRIKPPTFDNDNEIKFPSDARKNHLNYFATIVCDVVQVLEKVDILTGDKTIKEIGEVEKELAIGNIPIMVKSKYCSTQIKKDLHGECKYDPGGYFIVNGQEKVVMSIEKMVDNKALVFTKKETSFPEGFIHTAQINSRKNDWADNLQIVTIKNRKENDISITTSSLVDVPIFIMFRALGVESDQDIISKITYDISDVKMINLLRSSMEHSMDDLGNHIKTREEAVEYLASKLRKNRMISQTDEELAKIQRKMMLEKILRQDFLPHLGEDIPKKICYLGHMINKQLNVWLGRNDPDDRDALQNKRIETPGILIGQLFRQNWKKMLNEIGKLFAKKNQSDENPINVLNQIKPAIIEQGIKTALATGIWGMNKTKKGVAQSLQRLSWVQAISYLRRVMAPSLDSSTSKVTSIRQAQNLQVQFLCVAETPEGQKIGIVKSLAMMSSISHQNTFQDEVIKAVLKTTKIKHPADIDPLQMKSHTKLFMNGDWVGVCKVAETNEIYELLKSKRRNGVIDKYTSICLDYNKREIKIFYDGGRLIRPLLMVNNNKLAITKEVLEDVDKELLSKDFAKGWRRLLAKFTNLVEYEDIESSNYIMCADRFYRLNEVEENRNRKVEYNETSKINRYGDYRWIKYTHSDFHSWTQLGIIAGNIPFSNHNHSGRNIIHFSQAKQAISVYLTSYKDRMDISQILFYPQVPIVTTKTMEYNHCLDLPYGENAIVAIASYNGYNQEDSMVFNQSAIDRGIFRADTLKKYHSEIDKNPSTNQDDIFTKPDKNKVADMKQGNYGKLGEKGFAPEETEITNEDFIIGKVSPIQPTGDSNKVYKDSSEIFKSNVDGVIDRVHTGIYNAEGYEMYNVRVRMERVPVIGDKFSNRHGQKGTLGIALQQKDMPFTSDGMVPDLIMNPHCFTGETLISLPNGTSRRLDTFSEEGLEKVISWCPENKKSTMSYSVGLESKGEKEIIKITLIDGRELKCTPDHQFKVLRNNEIVNKEAKDIDFEDKLIMTPIGTEDKAYEEEDDWSLEFGPYKFNMQDDREREKSLAFARILGYIHTDGALCKVNRSNGDTEFKCIVYMGCQIDVSSILDDIEIVTGKRPKVQDNYSEHTNSSTYNINLSNTFAKALTTLSGITTGRKTTQETNYPEFLFEESCPKSIIREFLGGCFGGDGWAPHYTSGEKHTFTKVKFSQAVCTEYKESMETKLNQFIELMEKVNVEAEICRMRECVKDSQEYIDRPRTSFELQVKSNEDFRKNIGFRHCIQKLLRLDIACAYENYCEQVKIQHNNMIKKVNENMELKPNMKEALEKGKTDLYKDEKILNEYYSLLTPTLAHNRRKANRSTEINVFDYSYMETAEEFIKLCGADTWFDKGTYIVSRTDNHIPNYYLGIMKNEKAGIEEVFDIGVMEYHLFIANGSTVHNCLPSRMTIGQLVECVAAKVGAIEGHFVDGTPYCDYDVRKMPEMLEKLGFNKYGNEVLYCGMTGKKMEAEIFMGPTYQVRLKHMTADKYHSRSRGPRQALTRQPLEGRSRDGGLKIGKPFCLRVCTKYRLVCVVAGNIP